MWRTRAAHFVRDSGSGHRFVRLRYPAMGPNAREGRGMKEGQGICLDKVETMYGPTARGFKGIKKERVGAAVAS